MSILVSETIFFHTNTPENGYHVIFHLQFLGCCLNDYWQWWLAKLVIYYLWCIRQSLTKKKKTSTPKMNGFFLHHHHNLQSGFVIISPVVFLPSNKQGWKLNLLGGDNWFLYCDALLFMFPFRSHPFISFIVYSTTVDGKCKADIR